MSEPFNDGDILLVLGTTEADVPAEDWPAVLEGQRVLEMSFSKMTDVEAKACRAHVTMLSRVMTLSREAKSAKVRRGCRRVIAIIDARGSS